MCQQHLTTEERATRPTDAVGFVDEMVVAMTNSRIYTAGHPRVESSIEALADSLSELQGRQRGERVELGCADGFVFFDSRPLLGASLSARRLIEPLAALGSGGLAFDPTADQDALRTLVGFLSRGCRDVEDYTEANLALAQEGCTAVHFLPPYTGNGGGGGTGEYEGDVTEAISAADPEKTVVSLDVYKRLYQDVVYVMQDAMMKSCRGEAFDLTSARGHVESVLAQLGEDGKSLMSLARYELYDAFTFGHSIRVCFLALEFARHLTDDVELLERIGLAALLHDIGKAWVPFELLHSDGLLTPEQRREMSLHTVYGGQILLDSPEPDPLAVAVAFSHHQTNDGGGYPRSVRGARQSAATMIVKISDVYEALTAVRPYKPRMSPTRAYRIMMSMNGHFEPSLLRRFIEVNGVYPIGSRVRLTDGTIARVVAQGRTITGPIVETEAMAIGDTLFEEDIRRIDLTREGRGGNLAVEELLLGAEM
jgi:HD-GYP domain-containing protein (c-di-GMP phosphodiesterase class II)